MGSEHETTTRCKETSVPAEVIEMRLSTEDIETYASREGVKRIAVENFLMSIDTDTDALRGCLLNCHLDAKLYRWNVQTVRAIKDGIYELYNRESECKE